MGPVSATLEADLRRHVQRHCLSLWLDVHHHYNTLADHLAADADLPYTVLTHRGSFLELLLQLEPLTHGTDPTPLVIHLPGYTEESLIHTPLYPYHRAGKRYRKALDTLINEAAAGQLPPEEIEAFRSREGLSLEAADAWLAAHQGEHRDATPPWQAANLIQFIEQLLNLQRVAESRAGYHLNEDTWQRLSAWTGIPVGWRQLTLPTSDPRPDDVAFSTASWALCVEYVDHLRQAPSNPRLGAIKQLPRAVVDACRQLAQTLRERHADSYQRIADQTEDLLGSEIDHTGAEALGGVDTFRFQEETLLEATLTALRQGQWSQAARWSRQRLDGDSFWLRNDLRRRSTWQLLAHAAHLGEAIQHAGPGLEAQRNWHTAIARYTDHGAAVDRAHRHLEQIRATLLDPRLPRFETLREILDQLCQHWRHWADAWARDFNALCQNQGFLPPAELQQRNLFEQVLRPLSRETGTVALFMVDALRYEMAEQLRQMLGDPAATQIQLNPRLAELPSVTEVGMNALTPLAQHGKLRPVLSDGALKGFHSGEFQVINPDSRRRAISERIGGDTCPWLNLSEVLERDSASLKRSIARARLLVVHSREIDEAGEAGTGLDTFERVLQHLRAAWQHLREAGVRHFVFSADHGFLLIDEHGRSATRHGRRRDPRRRHVYAPVGADHPDKVGVALASLGYQDAPGYVLFPDATQVFDTGRGGGGFVHGGNSLQERLIPVLSISHRHQPGANALRHGIQVRVLEEAAGMHCLEIRVEVMDQQGLDFGGDEQLELALRVPDNPAVQVELCQVRGGASLSGASLKARVGEAFELFFRLAGPDDQRVLVELHHPGSQLVSPTRPEQRFPVNRPQGSIDLPTVPVSEDWLQDIADAGARRCLAHLQQHGSLSEADATRILGSPRAFRRFALRLDEHARLAPFEIRIEVVGTSKRYLREGNQP